jgi:hypothetical protein
LSAWRLIAVGVVLPVVVVVVVVVIVVVVVVIVVVVVVVSRLGFGRRHGSLGRRGEG